MGNIQSLATSAIILQALIAVLKLEEEELGEFLDPTRSEGNRHRDRGYALREVNYLTDAHFKTMFRMSRESFEKLLGLVEPFLIETDTEMAWTRHLLKRTSF